ncbi:hypothetical protein THRCLA_23222 [Thraustotheca clavata]|uniref:Endonuclease/exonuclease/phosphatase domain-containing protein n=1 Tax=Thraustotheca clavata TaxID=74557 RepID=A0A1V9Y919_9STRA|nr:hypothetical protein THRCLA_23222 [Thraustotheca clavata]
MVFHHTIPGFTSLQHEQHLDIPDHYMVVSATWGDTQIFYHNVYSPISNSERALFYSSLPRNFSANAKHVIFGDFNFPMDRLLDSSSATSNHHTARDDCFIWLQELNVVDPWRIHNPTARVYSSPKRNNRLDYILLDEHLCRDSYHNAEYFEPLDDTDHMWHKVIG